MKKISLICLLAVISCLTSVAFVYAGWPINRTLPIEGTVTDATTGEPIENVIISAEWVKEVFALVDNLQMIVSQKLIVTGKDGRYKIPGKISLHIISRFYKVGISLRHPLYESKVGLGNDYRWNARDKKELKKGTTGWYYDRPEVKNPNEKVPVYGYYKDGKIHFDIKLLSLEEKYREIKNLTEEEKILVRRYRELKAKHVGRFVDNLQKANPIERKEEIAKIERDFEGFRVKNKKIEKISKLIRDFDNETGQVYKYIRLAKELSIIKELDFNFILKKWSEITNTLPESFEKELVERRIENVRKELLSGELHE